MKYRALAGMLMIGSMAVLWGCASSRIGTASAPIMPADAQHALGPGVDGKCVMNVPGATVTLGEVEGGVAVVFLTDSNAWDVSELRQRVRSMAASHNLDYTTGGVSRSVAGENEPSQSHREAMMSLPMPAAAASVYLIFGGARLLLRAIDPGQVEALREHARLGFSRMARGECPRPLRRVDPQVSAAGV